MIFKSPLHPLCILLAAAALFLFSCGKDSDKNLLFQNCSTSGGMIGFFNQIKLNSDYVLSYSEQDDCYVFEFAQAESIAISNDCITSITENPNKQSITITYFDGLTQQVSFGLLKVISYIHNPLGYTPLSGQMTVNSEVSGELRVNLKKKNNLENPQRTYPYTQGEIIEIPVLGLYYNFDNEIYIEFIGADQSVFRDTFNIPIGNPPGYLPELIVDIAELEEMEPGMNFISYRSKSNPTVPFMTDAEGEVRYVLDFSLHPDLSTLNYDVGMERLQNGNLYFGAWPTSDLYEVDVLGRLINHWVIPGHSFHHNIQEKANGNFLVTTSKIGDVHGSGKMALEDHIIEVDRISGQIINTWDLKQSLDEHRRTLGTDEFDNYIDWIHVNAVIEDPSDNTIIISGRFQGVVKLDYNNRVKWILNCQRGWDTNGRNEDLTAYLLHPVDQNGQVISDPDILEGNENHPDFEWPWYQHAPFLMDNGNLFVFDNGERRNYNFNAQYSRAVEYNIDHDNLRIQQVWQYGKERGTETYSRIVSDVDYLPQKNNILFCPGSRVNNPGGFGGKIVEVDYTTKNVVFEMQIIANDIVFHRAERMPLYPD